MMINRRRYMGEVKESILPPGYTLLDYIENNSAAYINLNIKTSPSHRYEFEIYSNTGNNSAIFGSGGTDVANYMLWSVRFPSDGIKFYLPTSNYYLSSRDDKFHKFIVDFPNSFVQFDNEEQISIYNTSSTILFYSEFLFAYSRVGNVDAGYRLLGGCKSYKVFDNNVPICDLIPCMSADNIVGMYDIVREQFFGPATSDVFIAHY